jgi:hypothetical protein
MPYAGFEPTILVTERPQTHALDRTATGIGVGQFKVEYYSYKVIKESSTSEVSKYKEYYLKLVYLWTVIKREHRPHCVLGQQHYETNKTFILCVPGIPMKIKKDLTFETL